jgi:hypothetical protein
MLFTPLVYASGYLVLIFLAICMACGLYYMAELAEEYSRLTRKILYWSIIVVAAIHVLLLVFDGFPWVATFFGLAMHLVYFQFLKDFPYVNFSSPLFIGACGAYLSTSRLVLPGQVKFSSSQLASL